MPKSKKGQSCSSEGLCLAVMTWAPRIYAGAWAFARSKPEENIRILVDIRLSEETPHPGAVKPDGIIAAPHNHPGAKKVLALGLPTVNIHSILDFQGMPSVLVDNQAVGRLGAEHMLERNSRHFAFLGISGVYYSQLRWAGFSARVKEAGLASRRLFLPADWEANSSVNDQLNDWVAGLPKPVAIMGATDLLARRVAMACQRLSIAIPDEAAILGVNNSPDVCDAIPPTLSSVDNNTEEVGYQAAALLYRLIRGQAAPTETILIRPNGVQTRQSTDALLVDDPLVSQALRYLNEHAHEHITVQDVVKAVSASRRALEKAFRKALDRTPHDELLRVRIERIKVELAQTDRKISDIAMRSGFGYAKQMYQSFRQSTGVTPAEYRRRFHRS